MKTIWLSEMVINVKPYPWHERFRVALSCLLFGTVSFRGQLIEVKPETKYL